MSDSESKMSVTVSSSGDSVNLVIVNPTNVGTYQSSTNSHITCMFTREDAQAVADMLATVGVKARGVVLPNDVVDGIRAALKGVK